MALDLKSGIQETVTKVLKSELESVVGRIREELVEAATAEFRSRIREAIGVRAISVADFYTVERIGGELLIRVRIEPEVTKGA
jgi:hypothetical protein